jgi:hypothetical protein
MDVMEFPLEEERGEVVDTGGPGVVETVPRLPVAALVVSEDPEVPAQLAGYPIPGVLTAAEPVDQDDRPTPATPVAHGEPGVVAGKEEWVGHDGRSIGQAAGDWGPPDSWSANWVWYSSE